MAARLVLLIVSTSIALTALAASPEAPAPPVSADAQISVPGGTLHGTKLMPATGSRVPVVLIIAGSGPTDRNGNSRLLPGHNDSLRMLADGLAAHGIGSLRYDKRGIGESSGAGPSEIDFRFGTLVDDAVAWCNDLRHDAHVSRVTIAGHSEGSLIGMLAAKRCGAAAFISIEGAGRPAADIIRMQVNGKLTPELDARNEAILVSLEQGKTVAEVPQELMVLYRPSVQPYLISWFSVQPEKALGELRMPILILQGTTDIQVSVDDARRLAAANPRAKLVIVDGMNHILKLVDDDRLNQARSYSDPSLPVAPAVITAIADFIRSER